MSGDFNPNETYENVYFVFIDAAGHSNIVSSNPKDVSEAAFDLMYNKIDSRLKTAAQKNRCNITKVWSWLGDGGVFAIYDKEENNALSTMLKFVCEILRLDLVSLRDEFLNEKINGEIHIRIAVTKGTIKYTSNSDVGFVHSCDINRGSHLEKACIVDSIAISNDIYDILSNNNKKKFIHVGEFEEHAIYIHSEAFSNKQIKMYWIMKHGFEDVDNIQRYMQRISQKDKAELIDLAKEKVIDFGTTLHTCSNYLYSTERPLAYKEAVCRLLNRGGSFVCYMLEPDSEGARQLIELRKENTNLKLHESMEKFSDFKKDNTEITELFKVYQYKHNPNLAAMVIDPDSEDALCLYSPYLNAISNKNKTERADMPHYLISKRNNPIYKLIWSYISKFIAESKEFL